MFGEIPPKLILSTQSFISLKLAFRFGLDGSGILCAFPVPFYCSQESYNFHYDILRERFPQMLYYIAVFDISDMPVKLFNGIECYFA